MKIEFQLPKYNRITRSFCNYMVRWVQKDIERKSNIPAIQLRLDYIMNNNLIDWVKKPRNLSANHFIDMIIKNIDWKKVRNRYIIEVNPNVVLTDSNTPLILIAKLINYGSFDIKGTFFLSKIFIKYQENVYKYWALYRMKLQR